MRQLISLVFVAAALAGCGDHTSIEDGGRAPGTILTVYTLVPHQGPRAAAAADLVRGAKLALARAGGHVGKFTVQFASANEPDGSDLEATATAVRNVVSDTGTIAVIGDLDTQTAAISAPILNAVGLLHVSPLSPATFIQPAAQPTFTPLGLPVRTQAVGIVQNAAEPIAVEAEPGGEPLAAAIRDFAGHTVPTAKARTVVYAGSDPVNARGVVEGILRENRRARVILDPALASTDLARTLGPRVSALAPGPALGLPIGFAAAFPGVEAGPYAAVGFDAMNAVLAALRRAGPQANSRRAVIRAFRAPQTASDSLPLLN